MRHVKAARWPARSVEGCWATRMPLGGQPSTPANALAGSEQNTRPASPAHARAAFRNETAATCAVPGCEPPPGASEAVPTSAPRRWRPARSEAASPAARGAHCSAGEAVALPMWEVPSQTRSNSASEPPHKNMRAHPRLPHLEGV